MTFEIKDFIETNIDLIAANEWKRVYDNAVFTLDSSDVGALTHTLLTAGIDPVHEGPLDCLPAYYMSENKITEYTIPDHIISLAEGCLSYTNIREIIIPHTVEYLDDYVFYGCYNLKKVIILGHIIDIGTGVFTDCHKDLVVQCKEGSLADMYAQDHVITVEYI